MKQLYTVRTSVKYQWFPRVIRIKINGETEIVEPDFVGDGRDIYLLQDGTYRESPGRGHFLVGSLGIATLGKDDL